MPRRKLRVRKIALGLYVVERLAYIDTVIVRTTRSIEGEDYELLRRTFPPDERFAKDRFYPDSWEYVDKETGEIRWHHVLYCHQPTKETFKVMEDIQKRQPDLLFLLGVDFALDLTTNSESDAAILDRALQSVFVPARLPLADHAHQFETTYIGKKRSKNRLVMYCDGVRKVRPEIPRVHLEWRIRGKTALERASIYGPADLVRFDHRAFWAKQLRLRVMPQVPRLVRNLELRAARKKGHPLSPQSRERLKNVLTRLGKDYLGRFSAKYMDDALHAWYPGHTELYGRLANEWALPAPGNALWDEG